MNQSDADYFRQRETKSMQLADRAKTRDIRAIHLRLAKYYNSLVNEAESHTLLTESSNSLAQISTARVSA